MGALKSVDWPRVILILVNVPFLVLIHLAFICHVIASVGFYAAMCFSRKDIYLTFKKHYVKLVVELFKPEV